MNKLSSFIIVILKKHVPFRKQLVGNFYDGVRGKLLNGWVSNKYATGQVTFLNKCKPNHIFKENFQQSLNLLIVKFLE